MKDLEYFYWSGFIAADGYFLYDSYKQKYKMMRVVLSKKDKRHLELMKKYFGEKNCWGINISPHKPEYCYLIWKDNEAIRKMENDFDFKEKKTYNPPSEKIIDSMNDEQFLSFLCGYIDGDGCIQYQSGRKDCQLNIHVHSSWLNILNKIKCRLENLCKCNISFAKVMNDGYSKLNISNIKILRQLKQWVIKNRHPYLKRKWNKIDENKTSKYEWPKKYTSKVIELRNKGLTFEEIGKKLGIKTTTAFNYYYGKTGTPTKKLL